MRELVRGAILCAVVFGSTVSLAEAPKGAAPRPASSSAKASKAPKGGSTAPAPSGLVVIETILKPKADYQAETYSGVPLDDAYAKERGLNQGLVMMVFEKQRKPAFRLSHERISKIVHLVGEGLRAPVALTRTTAASPLTPVLLPPPGAAKDLPGAPAGFSDRVDVVESSEGTFVIETVTANAGIFTTSNIYAFPRTMGPGQRSAALERLAPATRTRVLNALTLAATAKP
ncbi:hypothetical protein AKJ09_07706 [Labilithrix luteola]|uniref:Uncharacterized protein n=1 Tax=Labilithrix luteola TaxID=1391654 RepID=A0A0K1Q5N0_9BACT|nr:hypothetical protein [Labilithrix luteola]AKV01043.1 hypothetical protein AKJ09_07706 [Labilithrix luteola]